MAVTGSQKVNDYEVPYDLLQPRRTNSYRCAVSHDVTQNTSIPAEPSWLKRAVKKLKSVFKRLRGTRANSEQAQQKIPYPECYASLTCKLLRCHPSLLCWC